ncbi:MAG TPA: MarR family transcriptional regulator [Streptosporangiaceae bacterium]|nr:MarR family transcriptional regulator [Streptosporangiaceae bacterium]
MDPIVPQELGVAGNRRAKAAIRHNLRALGIELSLLNHRIGTSLRLSDTDFDALNVISRYSPVSPRELAERCGLHPATATGVIDRLERGGWIYRERDPVDRRGVRLRFVPGRGTEMSRQYAGMNTSLREILDSYHDDELELIAGFLQRVADASNRAAANVPRQ